MKVVLAFPKRPYSANRHNTDQVVLSLPQNGHLLTYTSYSHGVVSFRTLANMGSFRVDAHRVDVAFVCFLFTLINIFIKK